MPVSHEFWLVALSIVVAIQGAYVGLSLAVQISEAAGMRRRLLLAGGAVSLGVAIWSMHFVGMLAMRVPFTVDYLVLPTLLSFLVCVIVVGAAIYAASEGPPSPVRLAAAATFMGLGIVSMHYLGMSALHASAHMHHAPMFVAASVAVAIATSGLALFLAGGRSGRPPLILSAAALGFAIAGMHYTAMAGLTVMPRAETLPTAPALSTDLLAIVVAVVAFGVSGIFLLTLVPDRRSQKADPIVPILPRSVEIHRQMQDRNPVSRASVAAAVTAEPVLHPPVAAQTESDGARPLQSPQTNPARILPVVRDGANHFVSVRDIVAVHANAHYTYVFDGTSKLFCPLPIGEVEARLDHAHFVRVHRSHIVNLERVIGLKRSGDHGLVELSGHDPYSVPVSRSRFTGLKSQLGLGPRQATVA
jgi:NO-binding membrane sensor protein with MHYT domain